MRQTPGGNWNRLRVILALVIALAFLFTLYQGGRWLERKGDKPENRGDHRQRYDYEALLEYDGILYRQRQNLTTILVMGIDQPSNFDHGSSYRNGGQADFLRLIVIDHERKRVEQIQIDRDTMTPITVLGVLGNRSGIRTAQISLSHGFGDGKADSCELTVEAVSNLFFGTPIDFYVSLNLDGISELNDLLGGVTVTLEDDFSSIDPSMVSGITMTLQGDQAEVYVRSRRGIGIGTNEARMKRQEQYLAQAITLIDEHQTSNREFVGEMYDALGEYLTTNLSRGQLINTAWQAKTYERMAPIKPSGSHEVGTDGFMQFYIDEALLQKTVLELFYEEVK